LQDSDIAIAAFPAQQPGGAKPVAELIPYEPSALADADKFLTAFDHSSNATYIIVNPSNSSLPWLAVWPGHGSDVRVVPNLDKQLEQLLSMDFVPGLGLVATNATHLLVINPDNGSFETVMPLSDRGLQNSGHATTDGSHLYLHLHDGALYYIATVNFSTSPASISLSLPNSMDNIFVAMHWSYKYNCLVAMRTSGGAVYGMQVGNQSALDAAQFEKVVEVLGVPHYTDCGLPKNNAATFVSGNYWYAALDCHDGDNEQTYQLTFIEMTSKNPKVIGEQIFGPMYEHAVPPPPPCSHTHPPSLRNLSKIKKSIPRFRDTFIGSPAP
jgi:hypothetical protein